MASSGDFPVASEEDADYPLDGPCHVALRLNGRPVAVHLKSGIGEKVMTEAQAAKLGLRDSIQPLGPGTMAKFDLMQQNWVPATGLLNDVRVEAAGKEVLQDFVVGAPPKPYDNVAMVKLGRVGILALGVSFHGAPMRVPSLYVTINGVELEEGDYRFAARKAKELGPA